jgi:hypothetical protein
VWAPERVPFSFENPTTTTVIHTPVFPFQTSKRKPSSSVPAYISPSSQRTGHRRHGNMRKTWPDPDPSHWRSQSGIHCVGVPAHSLPSRATSRPAIQVSPPYAAVARGDGNTSTSHIEAAGRTRRTQGDTGAAAMATATQPHSGYDEKNETADYLPIDDESGLPVHLQSSPLTESRMRVAASPSP